MTDALKPGTTQSTDEATVTVLNVDGEEIVMEKDPATGKFVGKKRKNLWETKDVGVRYFGQEMILPGDPENMPFDAAIANLQRLKADSEMEFAVAETIDAFVLDGAVAFWKALRSIFGFASPVPTPGMFGPKPPQMLTVQTGPDPDDAIQVPWGRMIVPTMDNPVETGVTGHEGMAVFYATGKLKRKHSDLLKRVIAEARRLVREESIYRGKAFELPVDEDGQMQAMAAPKFINVSDVREEELILNRDVNEQVNINLWTLIRQTAECVAQGIPIKRGIVFEGVFGTGKSLTARMTARICVENGWTFILLPHIAGLEYALKMARRYAPAVVFAEDMDRMFDERDDAANHLINVVDGVVSKDMKIITVFTTNMVDKIERVMLRPGRLDAMITFNPPDPEAVQRLIQLYARGRLAEGITLEEIGNLLAGEIPATIREVVERSKLAMISRGDSSISEEDLIATAFGMGKHLNLLKTDKVPERQDVISKFGDALLNLISEGARTDDTIDRLDSANGELNQAENHRGSIHSSIERSAGERHDETGAKLSNMEGTINKIAKQVGAR